MTQSLSPRVEAVFWFLLTATGYFLLASLSLHATKGADNIAAVWPPSGYFLALLLLMPAHVRPRISAFAGMAAASFAANLWGGAPPLRSEEHTSELQSLMRISYAVFCLKKKNVKRQKKIQ